MRKEKWNVLILNWEKEKWKTGALEAASKADLVLVDIPKGYKVLMNRYVFVNEEKSKIDKALDLAFQYGNIDGNHHKMWVIDQMIRELTGDKYDEWVKKFCDGEEGPNSYDWDVGVAP